MVRLCLVAFAAFGFSCTHVQTTAIEGNWQHPVTTATSKKIVQELNRFAAQKHWKGDWDSSRQIYHLERHTSSGFATDIWIQLTGMSQSRQLIVRAKSRNRVFNQEQVRSQVLLVLSHLKQTIAFVGNPEWIPELEDSQRVQLPGERDNSTVRILD
jgi:hypothetical protein